MECPTIVELKGILARVSDAKSEMTECEVWEAIFLAEDIMKALLRASTKEDATLCQ